MPRLALTCLYLESGGGCFRWRDEPSPALQTEHGRPEAAQLLDERLQNLSTQIEVHAEPATPYQAMGARGRSRTAQARLDKNPNAMRTRRETVEHPFGTLKMRMGATHFLCVTLPKVATEMALCVLGYNLTRVLNIVGMKPLLAAVRA